VKFFQDDCSSATWTEMHCHTSAFNNILKMYIPKLKSNNMQLVDH